MRKFFSCSKKSLTSLTVADSRNSSVVLVKDFINPPITSILFFPLTHKSWSYSKKTRKLWSLWKMGWFASRHRKTSCIATVFLNVAKYSASSSCFILLNSSLVIVPSPSPNFCSFSRDASKSGRGGAGGII